MIRSGYGALGLPSLGGALRALSLSDQPGSIAGLFGSKATFTALFAAVVRRKTCCSGPGVASLTRSLVMVQLVGESTLTRAPSLESVTPAFANAAATSSVTGPFLSWGWRPASRVNR